MVNISVYISKRVTLLSAKSHMVRKNIWISYRTFRVSWTLLLSIN